MVKSNASYRELFFPPCGGRMRSLVERSEPLSANANIRPRGRSWMGGAAARTQDRTHQETDAGRLRRRSCGGTPHPNLPPQRRAIAYAGRRTENPPPTWGRSGRGLTERFRSDVDSTCDHPAHAEEQDLCHAITQAKGERLPAPPDSDDAS